MSGCCLLDVRNGKGRQGMMIVTTTNDDFEVTIMCDQLTKRGNPCKFNSEVCPVHNLTADQLAERNRKATLAALKNPKRRQQLSDGGKRGFASLVSKIQRRDGLTYAQAKLQAVGQAVEESRKRRLSNPSKCQLLMRQWLTADGWDFDGDSCEEEWQPVDYRLFTVDFVNHTRKLVIEVTSYGRNWLDSAGRRERMAEKRAILEGLGYRVVCVQMDDCYCRKMLQGGCDE